MVMMMKDAFSVDVFDAKSNEKLFSVSNTLDSLIEVRSVNAILSLKDSFIPMEALNDFFSGEYTRRMLRLRIRVNAIDSNDNSEKTFECWGNNSKLNNINIVSKSNRFMSCDVVFIISASEGVIITNFEEVSVVDEN